MSSFCSPVIGFYVWNDIYSFVSQHTHTQRKTNWKQKKRQEKYRVINFKTTTMQYIEIAGNNDILLAIDIEPESKTKQKQ